MSLSKTLLQQHIQVGDYVLVYRKYTKADCSRGFENIWTPSMDSAVGSVGLVTEISQFGYRLGAEDSCNTGSPDDPLWNGYQFPKESLVKVNLAAVLNTK